MNIKDLLDISTEGITIEELLEVDKYVETLGVAIDKIVNTLTQEEIEVFMQAENSHIDVFDLLANYYVERYPDQDFVGRNEVE